MPNKPVDAKTDVARYFRMWNTGDISNVGNVVDEGYIDHVSGIHGPSQLADFVTERRANNPGLHVLVDATLGDSGMLTVVGRVENHTDRPGFLRDMVWTFRIGDKIEEIWTYRGDVVPIP